MQQLIQAYIKWHIKAPHYWPFVQGNHWWLVDSPHKGPVQNSYLLHSSLDWWNAFQNAQPIIVQILQPSEKIHIHIFHGYGCCLHILSNKDVYKCLKIKISWSHEREYNQINRENTLSTVKIQCPNYYPYQHISRKTFIVYQTIVQWVLYILFRFVKSLIRHLGLAIGNVRHVWWFSWTLTYWGLVMASSIMVSIGPLATMS